MFNEFNALHDSRKSDSIQYFSFYNTDGDLLTGDEISVTLDDNGQFNVLTISSNGESVTYTRDEYTYTTECLYVLGIGFLIPGDIVKLHITDVEEYELGYGWHTNVSNQTIYSWYLKPIPVEDLFEGEREGFMRYPQNSISNSNILTFYKEYLETIEVVEFRKNRVYFDKL